MNIILIGIPGSGKSTQGNLLSRQLQLPYLSTGHIFRNIAKEKTKVGRYVKETVNSGLLIPDSRTIPIVKDYLRRSEYEKGFLLDGFPRTVKQAKEFTSVIDKVLYVEIPDKEALWRLAFRSDSSRDDDTVVAIKKRIKIFHINTKPVIEYYKKKGILEFIDGTKKIKEVNCSILKALGKEMVENRVKDWVNCRKRIIALIGLPGAGKSQAAHYFREKGLPVLSLGDVVSSAIDKLKMKHTLENHREIRQKLRNEYGMEAMVVLKETKMRELLKKNDVVVLDGVRSWEEYLFLKDKFADCTLHLLAIHASKEVRYDRMSKRKKRKTLTGEERDIDELIGTNMGPTIAFSDFIVLNSGSIEELEKELEKIYREIYYS